MLTQDFISLCENFSKSHDNVLDEYIEESKKFCKYTIEFFNYIIEFRYIKKESGFYKASSLYCVIATRKNSVIYYHLTDIIPFLKKKNFEPCYFFLIENKERLSKCFGSLERQIENVLSQIEPFLYDDTLLLENLYESYKNVFNLKDNDIDFSKIENKNEYAHKFFLSLQGFYDGYVFSRYTNFAPYALLIKNKVGEAVEKYDKLNEKGKLFLYEHQLLECIKNHDAQKTSFFEFDYSNFESYKRFQGFSSFLKAFLVVFVASSVMFCGFGILYNFIISYNAEIVLSAPWYAYLSCAALVAICGSITLFQYMPNKHLTKKQRMDFSRMLISKGLKKFSVVLLAVAFVVSLFFAIMMAIANMRFYDDRIAFGDLNYKYEEIDSVYYIEARHNAYGDRIERSSYVILFSDKTSRDLDGYASVEYSEETILPFLIEKAPDLDIKKADSEKDLPWYTDREE